MFRLLVIMISLMTFIGCTHKSEEIKPADNVSVALPQKQFEWKKERKDFWISLTFSKLSWNPAVRQSFLPETLFDVSKCIIDTMERRYDIESFEKLNNDSSTTPEFINEISGVSRLCSQKGIIEQNKRIQQQKLENPNVKDML